MEDRIGTMRKSELLDELDRFQEFHYLAEGPRHASSPEYMGLGLSFKSNSDLRVAKTTLQKIWAEFKYSSDNRFFYIEARNSPLELDLEYSVYPGGLNREEFEIFYSLEKLILIGLEELDVQYIDHSEFELRGVSRKWQAPRNEW